MQNSGKWFSVKNNEKKHFYSPKLVAIDWNTDQLSPDLECGMPADIPNGRLIFVNGTRQFKSLISYKCDTGHVLVGRSELMCDVDQRWNGPPPRSVSS